MVQAHNPRTRGEPRKCPRRGREVCRKGSRSNLAASRLKRERISRRTELFALRGYSLQLRSHHRVIQATSVRVRVGCPFICINPTGNGASPAARSPSELLPNVVECYRSGRTIIRISTLSRTYQRSHAPLIVSNWWPLERFPFAPGRRSMQGDASFGQGDLRRLVICVHRSFSFEDSQVGDSGPIVRSIRWRTVSLLALPSSRPVRKPRASRDP